MGVSLSRLADMNFLVCNANFHNRRRVIHSTRAHSQVRGSSYDKFLLGLPVCNLLQTTAIMPYVDRNMQTDPVIDIVD